MTPDGQMHRMLAVVVLYETAFADSRTLRGLAQAYAEDPGLFEALDVLLWDNSPQAVDSAALPFRFEYRHADHNTGVAGAYNGAAAVAQERGCTWLLLLDQDTTVTSAYLRGIQAHAARDQEALHIAVIVPFLLAGTSILSPRLWRFARHQALPRPAESYVEERAMFAANSGTLLRADALRAIGGYRARFWLDYSDIYVFHRLHQQRYGVRIAADLELQHDIAMQNYDERMTPWRYGVYLAAEGDFLDLYRGPAERAMHLLRLAARVLRQRRRYASPVYARMSLQALLQRLTTRRSRRLATPQDRSVHADRD